MASWHDIGAIPPQGTSGPQMGTSGPQSLATLILSNGNPGVGKTWWLQGEHAAVLWLQPSGFPWCVCNLVRGCECPLLVGFFFLFHTRSAQALLLYLFKGTTNELLKVQQESGKLMCLMLGNVLELCSRIYGILSLLPWQLHI